MLIWKQWVYISIITQNRVETQNTNNIEKNLKASKKSSPMIYMMPALQDGLLIGATGPHKLEVSPYTY